MFVEMSDVSIRFCIIEDYMREEVNLDDWLLGVIIGVHEVIQIYE